MRAQRWPRATAIAVALLATTATCQTDLITRPAKSRELAREDCVSSDIRIVEGLKGNVTTSTGLRCIPPNDCTARIDGVVWDATHPPHKIDELVSKQREKREAHPNAIFIAFSHEAYSHLWNRKIGNSKYMEQMNYAIRYGADPDFPAAFTTYFSASYKWARTPPDVFKKKTQGILYLSSNCNTASQRDSLAYVASYHMDIDSVGKCVNNKMFPRRLRRFEFDERGHDKREMWGNYGDALEALVKTYHFRLLIISTLCENYFAEKIIQTLVMGTIPIYLGIPNSHDWDPGIAAGVHPAMIHIQDFKSLGELAKYVEKLSEDTEEARQARLKFFEYQKAPPFKFPRHLSALVNRSGGYFEKNEFICGTVHKGDPARKTGPQPRCEGAWFEYLERKGYDLEKWDVDLAKNFREDEEFYLHLKKSAPPSFLRNFVWLRDARILTFFVCLIIFVIFFRRRKISTSMLAGEKLSTVELSQ